MGFWDWLKPTPNLTGTYTRSRERQQAAAKKAATAAAARRALEAYRAASKRPGADVHDSTRAVEANNRQAAQRRIITTAPRKPSAQPRGLDRESSRRNAQTALANRVNSNMGAGGGVPAGIGSNATGQVTPTLADLNRSVDSWIGEDPTYTGGRADLVKALNDFKAQQGTQTRRYNQTWQDQYGGFTRARDQGYKDLADEYASRGVIDSGYYANALQRSQSENLRQETAMNQAKAQYGEDTGTALNNFQTEQSLAMNKLKQDAIARRAARLGILS